MSSPDEVARKRIKSDSEENIEEPVNTLPDLIPTSATQSNCYKDANLGEETPKVFLKPRPPSQKQKGRVGTARTRAAKHKGIQIRALEYFEPPRAGPQVLTPTSSPEALDNVDISPTQELFRKSKRRSFQKTKLLTATNGKSILPLQPVRLLGNLQKNGNGNKTTGELLCMPMILRPSSSSRQHLTDKDDSSVPQMPSIVTGVSKPIQQMRFGSKLTDASPTDKNDDSSVPIMPAIKRRPASGWRERNNETGQRQGRTGAVPVYLPKLEQQMEESLIGRLSYLSKEVEQKKLELRRETSARERGRLPLTRPLGPIVNRRQRPATGNLGIPSEPKLRGTSARVYSRSERNRRENERNSAHSRSSVQE